MANRQEVVDDHQSPAKPVEYLQLRILPLLNFYKKRLPLYYRIRTYIEFLLILGGLGTTILAFLQYWWYAPIVAVCAAATTAWLEFSDTSKKLARYSDVVHQVDNIVYWWESLTDVDRASLANIEQVCVSGCSVRDSTLCLHASQSTAPSSSSCAARNCSPLSARLGSALRWSRRPCPSTSKMAQKQKLAMH